MERNQRILFALLQAGLWETEVRLVSYGKIDFETLYRLAEEQSIIGLVAAGLEHVTDMKLAKKDVTRFIASTVQHELRNQSMNRLIESLVEQMYREGISVLLVKGQGVAQCYNRPLWRSCGDVDFLLDEENYVRAKRFLSTIAQHVNSEEPYSRHIGMTVNSWVVELHGTLRCGLSSRTDKVIDRMQEESCCQGNVRIWKNGEIDVLLPGVNNDVLFIFTHFLKHFYRGGLGLRQICDWCRLLWTYQSEVNVELLEDRLRQMGLMSEWKAFASFAVDYLDMPVEAMPLYSNEKRWKRKASLIKAFVMKVGNLGHNRDTSYFKKYPFLIRKTISMEQRIGDLIRHSRIFPLDSVRFFPKIMFDGVRSAVKGE